MSNETSLGNRRILVVEDEYFLAAELAQELVDAGATVIGPAPTLERAFELLSACEMPDAAILDVNLGGDPVFPLADRLRAEGIPMIFTTGYDPATLPDRYVGIPTYGKPINAVSIADAIARQLHH